VQVICAAVVCILHLVRVTNGDGEEGQRAIASV